MQETLEYALSFIYVRLLQPHRLYPAWLLCPWDSPGKNTGVGCHFLLYGIFLTQESNPGHLHCRQTILLIELWGKTLETQVQSLSKEDPLEEDMATNSNIFAWSIPWTEEPGGLKSIRLQKVINIEQLWKTILNYIMIKEWVQPSKIRKKKNKQKNRDICSWYFYSTLY